RLKLDNTCLKNVRLAHGDIFKLDFVDNYFDVTICWRFCHLVPVEYLHHALKELGRVTSGEILLQAYIGRPYWKRLLTSLFRFPGKFYMKLKGSRSAPLPWSHIHAYFHTDQLLASKIAEAGLVINRQVKIGPYNDSIVSVYHLRKW
ncbi:MAG: methyltransferase domain-containing protein, partial [Nitrosomonas ureae]